MIILGQPDLVLGVSPKGWLITLGGAFVTLVAGRFFQAFKNGEGLIGAGKAVLFGTNTPKPPEQK